MKISIIIPTYQAEKNIEKLLLTLQQQNIEEKEIIIIDSSSTDNTVKIAGKYTDKIIVIAKEEFNHGGTRNTAAKNADGDILVFLTQDALPENEFFLAELIKPVLENKAAASYGCQVPQKTASVIEKFARSFNYPDYDIIKSKKDIADSGIKTFFFTNVCSAVKRDKFEEIGQFPERIILNEDMLLAGKLILTGYNVAYVSQAKVYHSHNYSYWQQFQRNFDIGVSLKMNPWILQYAKTEKEGLRYLKEQMRYLYKNKYYWQILNCLLDTGFRFMGYKAGINYNKLPLWLIKKLSMHSFFWSREI